MGNEQDEREGREIRRRSDEETERERRATKQVDELPGGAEGGEESRSKDLLIDAPHDDDAAFGDTDQHSSDARLPPHRERRNRERQER